MLIIGCSITFSVMKKAALSLVDNVGVGLSMACLVHCVLLPFIIPFLPFMAIFASEKTHEVLAVVLLAVAVLAFARGYKVHGQKHVLVMGVVGISALIVAVLLPHELRETRIVGGLMLETVVTIPGSLLLVVAHVFNIRHCHCKPLQEDCSCVHP